jgi:hypothetical protein
MQFDKVSDVGFSNIRTFLHNSYIRAHSIYQCGLRLSSILSYCIEYLASKLWIHFREIFKEVVAIEKDIARKKAKEIARKKEEERQKQLEAICTEVCIMSSAEVEGDDVCNA